jgi:hypothetical protein
MNKNYSTYSLVNDSVVILLNNIINKMKQGVIKVNYYSN